MRRHWQNVVFALLVATALALAVLGAVLWSGHLVSDPSGPSRPQRKPTATKRAAPSPQPVSARSAAPTTAAPAPAVARVTIVATRGDCWVAAHKGSPDGPVLLERTLSAGERVTLRGRRISLQLGAAGNVDISVNGKEQPVPAGTTSLVLG